jgi:YqjK-like protein
MNNRGGPAMRLDDRLRHLAKRRDALCERAHLQRRQFAVQFSPITLAARRADMRIASASRLALTPIVITAAAVTLMFLGPRRLLGWARKGLEAWLLWRTFAAKLPAILPRRFG